MGVGRRCGETQGRREKRWRQRNTWGSQEKRQIFKREMENNIMEKGERTEIRVGGEGVTGWEKKKGRRKGKRDGHR